jgi:hypothetical protein
MRKKLVKNGSNVEREVENNKGLRVSLAPVQIYY